MNKILTGKKQIQNFVGRDWRVIMKWIVSYQFPATKLGGIWESDADLIVKWRQDRIQNKVCQV
jgi:hypothetical protein